MAKVIGVRFKDGGKVYYFDPGEIEAKTGEYVIVETARGIECGTVAQAPHEVEESELVKPLKQVLRAASPRDIERAQENRRKEKRAFGICQQKIAARGMEMKLVDVEYAFDGSKILFYFTADGRVDFRELVKDLAAVFRTRIELRQIGVRDEAKMLGGLGLCGREFCCASFLSDFQPVSIRMAKDQGLSLNPTKISGACGRLMCCLKYEQAAYEDLLRNTPRQNASVMTPDGRGTVTEVSLLTGMLKVRLDGDAGEIKSYHKSQLEGGLRPCPCRRKDGEEGSECACREKKPPVKKDFPKKESAPRREAAPDAPADGEESPRRAPRDAAPGQNADAPRRRRRRGGVRHRPKTPGQPEAPRQTTEE